jgi:CBS domain containing-hemolysin-like protein
MRPKEEIIAFNMEEALTKIVHLFVDQECTRIPIYQHSLDQVMGILNAKDYFVYRDKIKQPLDLVPLLKRPFFCPETASAKALLKQFDQNGEVFALVVNEYGVITGVITKEDLIELVVGAIVDRRDSTSYYTSAGKEAIIAMGQMEMEEIEEYFSVTLEVPSQVQTLGGWLTDRLGDIPPTGQVHQEGGLLFKVLSATPNRVKKVHISRGGS